MKWKRFVGIDVSKLHLDVALWHADPGQRQHLKIPNTKQGMAQLKVWLRENGLKPGSTLFCCEYTGLYNRLLLQLALRSKWNIWMEHPRSIQLSLGMQRGKSDPADAGRIAEYAARFPDKARLWQPQNQLMLRLGDLIAHRKRLITSKNQLLVPLQEIQATDTGLALQMLKTIRGTLNELRKAIRATEKQMEELIEQDMALHQQYILLLSVPGVGRILAWQLLYNTCNFQRLSNPRQLACYSGIAPFARTSGTSINSKARVNHNANKTLKSILHLAAYAAIKSDPEIRHFYHRLIERGKSKLQAANAVKNKLIHRICAVIRKQRPYVILPITTVESSATKT